MTLLARNRMHGSTNADNKDSPSYNSSDKKGVGGVANGFGGQYGGNTGLSYRVSVVASIFNISATAIQKWADSSIAGFKSESLMDFTMRALAAFPIEAGLAGTIGKLSKLERELAAGKKAETAAQEVAQQRATASRINLEVQKSRAPSEIESVHKATPNQPNAKDHVHFKDGTAVNLDGTPSHTGSGEPNITKEVSRFFEKFGWNIRGD